MLEYKKGIVLSEKNNESIHEKNQLNV